MVFVLKTTHSPRSNLGLSGALCVVFALGACPGEVPGIRVPDRGVDRGFVAREIGSATLDKGGGGKLDAGPADGATPQDDVNPGVCSPAGVATSCDPVAQTGCAAGACYMVGGKGKACVCPQGTTPAGGACNTTVECATGFGCQGDQPPGTCRRFCTTSDTCAGNETCRPITGYPSMGLCVPKR